MKIDYNKFIASGDNPDPEDFSKHQKPRREKASLSGLYFTRLGNPKYIKEAHTGKKPQAVFKVVSYARGHKVKNLISYLARAKEPEEKQIDVEDENGVLHESRGADEAIYNDWKNDFDRKKKGSKRQTRHAVHLLLSSAVKDTLKNAQKTLIAAKRTAEECFGKEGYKYAVVLHTDTPHPHAHVVVNMKNIDPEKKKLKINKPDIFGIRYKFAENLNKLDLYHSATLKQDRPTFVEKAVDGKAVVIENKNWFVSKLKTASLAGDSGSSTEENKKTISRAIFHFRKDIKKSGEKKNDTLNTLRILEKKIIDPKENIDKEIDKAMRLIGQDARRFRKYLDYFKQAKTSGKKKNSYAVMKKMRENIYKSIDIAEDIIKKTPVKEKKKIIEALKLHKKLMQGKIKLKEVEPIQKDFENAVKKFEKEKIEFEQHPKKTSIAKEFLRKKEFERIRNEHIKKIDIFRKEIIVSNAPQKDKIRAVNLIKNYQKGIEKILGRGLAK